MISDSDFPEALALLRRSLWSFGVIRTLKRLSDISSFCLTL
jgi:hypothetical protein